MVSCEFPWIKYADAAALPLKHIEATAWISIKAHLKVLAVGAWVLVWGIAEWYRP